MRLATTLRTILLAAMFVGAARAADAPDIDVIARLLSIQTAPGCGVFIQFSHAKYNVIAGPTDLVGKDIEVLVACAEMPQSFAPGEGEFKSFKAGEVHDLTLSRKNFIENGAMLPDHIDPAWWFLRSISMHVEKAKSEETDAEEAVEVKPSR